MKTRSNTKEGNMKKERLGIAIRRDKKNGTADGRPFPLLAFAYCGSGFIRLSGLKNLLGNRRGA
jgi:hypothetical protein